MASFSPEDFVGSGSLKALLPKLLDEGWDDVPTLKIMNPEEMNAMNMTQQQKDALEIRSYLHDRASIQYADKLEASGKCLSELLSLSTAELSSQFGMKRGHIARFMVRTLPSGTKPLPAASSFAMRRRNSGALRSNSSNSDSSPMSYNRLESSRKSPGTSRAGYGMNLEKSISDLKVKEGHAFKGIVAAMPADTRACGCVQPPSVVEDVAPYPALEKISIQRLAPEYKVGMDHSLKTKMPPPMKASEIWRDKPAVILFT